MGRAAHSGEQSASDWPLREPCEHQGSKSSILAPFVGVLGGDYVQLRGIVLHQRCRGCVCRFGGLVPSSGVVKAAHWTQTLSWGEGTNIARPCYFPWSRCAPFGLLVAAAVPLAKVEFSRIILREQYHFVRAVSWSPFTVEARTSSKKRLSQNRIGPVKGKVGRNGHEKGTEAPPRCSSTAAWILVMRPA